MAAERAGENRLSDELSARASGGVTVFFERYSKGIQTDLMELFELQEARRHRWHLDGAAVRTLEGAREYLDKVGFCTMYPLEQPVLLPSFMGAFAGTDEGIPT